jgi:hypothetical protein
MRKIRVIAILLDEAQMPGADELPATRARWSTGTRSRSTL